MQENVIKEKSASFAKKIVMFTRDLRKRKVESSLVNQLLRSGTSVGANIEEACAGISKNEFSMKLSISFKEARETLFWLNLLKETQSISPAEHDPLFKDCDEILRILWVILKKTRIDTRK